jgi:hypothetical protein
MSDGATALLDPDVATSVAEALYDRGWTDGLPTLPATEESVQRFLATTQRGADEVAARHPQLERHVTVKDVAVSAVMAGCLPEYFPVVLAVWDALSAERAALGGGWQSTSGPGPLIIVNGPVRHQLTINSGGGVLGPGFRANATIPRAIGLTVRNGFGIRPGELEQATIGTVGRWQLCVGENEEDSPWEPLSQEAGLEPGVSAVAATLVRTFEVVDNRSFTTHEEVLFDFVDTIQRSGALIGRHSPSGLLLNPAHARLFADAGMSKQDVREWIVAHAGRSEAQLQSVGKGLSHLPEGPFEPDHRHPTFADAHLATLPIIVTGSPNAAISMVFRVLGRWSGRSFPVR